MEGLVLLLISLIVGSVLKGKDKKEPPKNQPKPFTAQQQEEQNPIGKLKEMYKELQEELQGEAPNKQQERQMTRPTTVEAVPKRTEPSVTRQRERAEMPTRVSRHERQAMIREREEQKEEQRPSQAEKSLMPKTEEDLIKGVIFSEIFGPPKSRR